MKLSDFLYGCNLHFARRNFMLYNILQDISVDQFDDSQDDHSIPDIDTS